MNYKLLRFSVCGLYSKIFSEFFGKNNSLWEDQTYEQLSQKWFNEFYIYGDSLSHYLSKLGNMAVDFVTDNYELQTKWANQNGIKFNEKEWSTDIVLAQINFYRPDILYFQDIGSMSHHLRRNLKRLFPFLKKIIIFRGYPEGSLTYFQEFSDADIIFVGSPFLQKKLSQINLRAELLYHAFDERILHIIDKTKAKEKDDVVFCGITGNRADGHHFRKTFLLKCIKDELITIYSDDLFNKDKEKLNQKIKRKIFSIKYKKIIKKSVFGINYYQKLLNSKICLNIHSDVSFKEAENMRMFHATGVGSCLMTNSATNMKNLFEENAEVITFSNYEEFKEKRCFLLSNPEVLNSIARAGQQRTLKDHTWENRAKKIHEIILKAL